MLEYKCSCSQTKSKRAERRKKKMEQDVFDIETAAYDMAVDAASEEGD